MVDFGQTSQLAVDINANDNGASEAFEGVAGSANSMKMAVAAAGAVLAGAGAAGLAAAASAAADFEEAMVEVEKVTNAETADAMSESIRDLSETIPMAQEELAAIAADAARFGVRGPENIEAFTESVAKMAEATTLSADEAGQALARIAELTNTPVSEIENLGSSINELSNNFATSSQEIVDAMTRSSGALTQMGLTTTEIAGLSAAMNEVSESSRRAGTRLRRLGQEMMNPKKAGDLAAALGMTTEEFETMREESPNELLTMMAEQFAEGGEEADALRSTLSTTSRQALAGLSQNLDGLSEAQSQANSSFKEGTSLQREFEASTDTFNAKLQLLKNRLNNVAITTGNAMMPALTEALAVVSDLVKGFQQLNTATDGMAGVVAGVAAVVGGTAVALSQLGVTLGSITGAASTAAGAIGTVVSILGGPLTVAILAIVGVIATLAYAWNENLAGLQDKTDEVVSFLQKAFSAIAGALKEVFNKVAIPVINEFKRIWDQNFSDIAKEGEKTLKFIASLVTTYLDIVLKVWKKIFNLISDFWNEWGDEIITFLKSFAGTIELIFGTALDAIMTTVKVFLALLRGDWDQALEYILNFTQRTFDRIVSWITGSWYPAMKAAFELVIGVVMDIFKGLYNWLIGNSLIPEMFNAVVNFIKTTFFTAWKNIFKSIFKWFKNLWNRVFTWYKNLWLDIFNSVKSILGRLFTWYKNFWTGLFNWYKNLWMKIFRTVRNTLNDIQQKLKQVFRAIQNFIKNTWNSIKNFLGNTWSSIKSTFTNATRNVKQTVRSGFNAVDRVVTNVMNGIESFLGSTWDSITGGIKNSLRSVSNWISNTFNSMVRGAFNTVSNTIESIWNGIFGFVEDIMQDIYDETVGKIEDAVDTVVETFNNVVPDEISIPSMNVPPNDIDIPRVQVGLPSELGGGNIGVGGNELVGRGNLISSGQFNFDLPQLATGGIVEDATAAIIGEGRDDEAVMPLERLDSMLDRERERGSGEMTVRLRIEGDDELTEIIRENAEVVVEEHEESKEDRFGRLTGS